MADIELVIKIPEDEYRWIKKSDETAFANVASKECMLYAIKTGTPLSKGHGRIGDLSELETRIGNFIEYYKNLLEETNPTALVYMIKHILDGIRDTDTIIEADKENQNDD